MKLPKRLRNLTKDGFSTLIGIVGAAALPVGQMMMSGNVSKEVLVGAAIVGVSGYLHNKGNAEPVNGKAEG